MKENYNDILFLDEDLFPTTGELKEVEPQSPTLSEEECEIFKPILIDFAETWAENKDSQPEKWLPQKIQEYMPEKAPSEIEAITDEIILSVETSEKAKKSLSEAIASGRSKDSWFASQVQKATSGMAAEEASKYLAGLDTAVRDANKALCKTFTKSNGNVSLNPNLDGFIAEQYHVQTFNMNAEAKGSPYRAEVCASQNKNSVDVVIKDGNGNIVRRYQCKYCKDANATQNAFKQGDYRGQSKLVPDGQEGDVKGGSNVITAPDGTTSNPLTKERAKQMQEEAQSGNWNDLNWNEYKTKDIAIGIGKQARNAAIQGIAIGAGMDIASKLVKGEEIHGDEVIENALKSGADFGLKAAAGGALKVAVEKEIITVIPKGTPASTITNIAYVAIEDIKVIGKMASGEYDFKEGIDKIEQTTVAVAGGLVAMGKGAAIGASIGTVLGPVGTAVGGFIGGTIGYMAGSKVGEAVVKTYQKTRDDIIKASKKIGSKIRKIGKVLMENQTQSYLQTGIPPTFL